MSYSDGVECYGTQAYTSIFGVLQVKPLLEATRMDEVIAAKDDEIRKVKEVADKSVNELEELRKMHSAVVSERQVLLSDLAKERDHTAELDEERRLLANNKKNLEEYSHDLENRLVEEEEHLKKLADENKKLQQNFQDIEDQYVFLLVFQLLHAI